MRVAIIDLGSNSFQVFVADVSVSGDIDPVLVEREMLYLGRFVGGSGVIPDDEAIRAVRSAVRLLRQGLTTSPDEVVVVATSALREASNGAAILADIERLVDRPVRVLSGEEEARFAYAGALAGLPNPEWPLAVVDLGGGSLEVASGQGRRPDSAISLALGVSRLAAEVGVGEILTTRRAKHLRRTIQRRLATSPPGISSRGQVVIAGGAARSVARVILTRRRSATALESLHGEVLGVQEVRDFSEEVIGMSLEARLGLPGAKARRSLHLPVAAVILAEVAAHIRATSLTVSDWSLRHGLILDTVAAKRFEPVA